jgi:hypothetical protein
MDSNLIAILALVIVVTVTTVTALREKGFNSGGYMKDRKFK